MFYKIIFKFISNFLENLEKLFFLSKRVTYIYIYF